MRVCEIFTSIQGESTYAGALCTFIRMTGCNLRCSYCDTTYAYEEGIELSEDEIINRVKTAGINLVEITGGEPLLQKDALQLSRRLLDAGYKVLIETNGSQDISQIDHRAVIILDIKTPGSGMSDKNLLPNIDHLKPTDEIKFVITGRNDYVWAKAFIEKTSISGKCTILFSPSFGAIDPKYIAAWIIEDRLEVRLNLQLHNYLYGPDRRGV